MTIEQLVAALEAVNNPDDLRRMVVLAADHSDELLEVLVQEARTMPARRSLRLRLKKARKNHRRAVAAGARLAAKRHAATVADLERQLTDSEIQIMRRPL